MNDPASVKATISSGYRWRLILITFLMLGFGAYCIYDWRIGYPKIKEIGLAYQAFTEANPKDYPQLWPQFAAERGWSIKVPKKIKTPEAYDSDIFTQLIMALITVPLGLFFLVKLFVENGRWVAMDPSGIAGSGGRRVAWDAIERLDEERWKTKGIAYLHYRDETGRSHKMLLDDFKSEREPIDVIVKHVQKLLNPEAAPTNEAALDADAAAASADPPAADAADASDSEPQPAGDASIGEA